MQNGNIEMGIKIAEVNDVRTAAESAESGRTGMDLGSGWVRSGESEYGKER
jgi:hypothetical protein